MEEKPRRRKQTKVVCTMGPASETVELMKEMVAAGMNVCRLNFSHGTYEHHQMLLDNIRAVSAETNVPLAIMADLQGPRIRTGLLPEQGVLVKVGETVTLSAEAKEYKDEIVPVTYGDLYRDLTKGERVYIDDALVVLMVREIEKKKIVCDVLQGGTITTHRGMNFPDSKLRIETITAKDKQDLKFAIQQNVDYVALSFVAGAKDVYDLKYLIKEFAEKRDEDERSGIMVIAKIERREAVENIDEIIEAADGIMVARGDLGIELAPEDVPLYQRELVDKCLAAAKPVIIATQMLDSMTRNPRPTRAEVSDVANAVINHTDAMMLSAESATGAHPVAAVQTMTRIAMTTEESEYDDLVVQESLQRLPIDMAVSQVAHILAGSVQAKLILVASLSGNTARVVCRYRPELPIFATTDSERVYRQLNLSWGVVPFVLPTCKTVEELVDRSIGYLKKEKQVEISDKIIVIAGDPVGSSGVNLVEIREIK